MGLGLLGFWFASWFLVCFRFLVCWLGFPDFWFGLACLLVVPSAQTAPFTSYDPPTQALQHIARTHQEHPTRLQHLVSLLQDFEYQSHFCTVYEICGPSLYDVLKRHGLKGLPLARVRHYTQQVRSDSAAIAKAF